MLRSIYYTLPPSLRRVARRLFYLPSDVVAKLKRQNLPVPPKGLIHTGGGDFLKVGRQYLEYLIRDANLQPGDDVLDIGCGIGRMALPLTTYLLPDARYEGFDIMPHGIRWCQKNITSRCPNFHFRTVALANDLYTVGGADASKFHFPYADAQFNIAIATSVFSHMITGEVTNYLAETSRVLKPGGILYATFFVLNDFSRENMASREFRFDYPDDGCYLMDAQVRSANVAYDEDVLRSLVTRSGFSVEKQFYGKWSGRTEAVLDFQDILILRKS